MPHLIRAIIEDFAPHFAPDNTLVNASDTGDLDAALLASLGVTVTSHAQMPDVVLYHAAKNRRLPIESATNHGPIDEQRRAGLASLFAGSTAGLLYGTAFPNRATMARSLADIAWETEVWVADAPSHLIHFDQQFIHTVPIDQVASILQSSCGKTRLPIPLI